MHHRFYEGLCIRMARGRFRGTPRLLALRRAARLRARIRVHAYARTRYALFTPNASLASCRRSLSRPLGSEGIASRRRERFRDFDGISVPYLISFHSILYIFYSILLYSIPSHIRRSQRASGPARVLRSRVLLSFQLTCRIFLTSRHTRVNSDSLRLVSEFRIK